MPRLTIDLKQQGFSRESALYFANVCDLAYSDDPRAAAREVLGLDATVFNHLKSDTQGFVGRGDGFSVLAFRGSEKLNQHPKDWINDIRALQVSEDPFTGRVHAGFSRTVNAAWESVSAVLRPALQAVAAVGADDPAIPLFITGHSLGGALATFAAFRLTPGLLPAAGDNPAVRFNLRATYTFGAPRVGNVEFSKTFLVPPLYRVVNNLDLVPLAPLTGVEAASFGAHLPGFVPAWIREMARQAEDAPFYADVETLIHLDNDGNSTEGGSRPDWLTAYTKQALKSLFRSLDSPVTDHFIDSYIQALSR